MYFRKIVDTVNNIETIEELSNEEIKEIELNIEQANKEIQELKIRQETRKSALSKLIDLGLTEDEIAAL